MPSIRLLLHEVSRHLNVISLPVQLGFVVHIQSTHPSCARFVDWSTRKTGAGRRLRLLILHKLYFPRRAYYKPGIGFDSRYTLLINLEA